ncbi:MAG TPA: response regulator, partial [Dissulfurispiraceae bacterium]|nr:response regulator [Dissulfurispiraceae bacterium]
RSKIFEPFFTTKEVGRGTGLGLAVVYGIVKQHKGHISVCSRLGTGTVFKIYLPLANASVHKDDNEKVTDNGSFNAGTETILIAEDDDMFRNSAAGVLRSHGYNVIEAVDGQDAIARFIDNRDSIRLVVLDGIMPKISGKDAWEEIRSLNPNIKTLFISGYADDTCITTGIPHKGVVFMGKPVTPSELVSVVRRLLDE